MKLTYTAGERDEGRKIYHVLRRDLKLSSTQVKRLKVAHGVLLNGVSVFTDFRVKAGDTVAADLSVAEDVPDFPPERGTLDILYENAAYLAVNKSPGLIVHPTRSRLTGTLVNVVAGYLLEREGSTVCHAVNRLDRDTSGVVLFAKSAHFKALAMEALQAPEAEKIYRAYLFGALPGGSGTIDLPIERAEPGMMRRVVRETGKRAVTRFETLRRMEINGCVISEVRLWLETGRTHQIRVHCAHLGAPILGDRLYGSRSSTAFSGEHGLDKQLLHAESLRFSDPLTGEQVQITAPFFREDMRKCANFFRNCY